MIDAGTESPTNVTRTGALAAGAAVPARIAAAIAAAARQAVRRARMEIVWAMARNERGRPTSTSGLRSLPRDATKCGEKAVNAG